LIHKLIMLALLSIFCTTATGCAGGGSMAEEKDLAATARLEELGGKHVFGMVLDDNKEDWAFCINLNTSEATDDDMALLAFIKLKALDDLRLYKTRITDKGIEHVAKVAQFRDQLRCLIVGENKIADASLQAIGQFRNLKKLYLNGTKITDDGLKSLKPLQSLVFLRLDDTDISDAGLLHLFGLHGLRHLNLNDTRITKKGIDDLEFALPFCQVVHSQGKRKAQDYGGPY
jgi:hypothetical protein